MQWCIDWQWLFKHYFNLIMYLTYFIRLPLCTAAGTQCWKQNQNVRTKTEAASPRPRPVWDRSCNRIAVSNPKTGGGCPKSKHRRTSSVNFGGQDIFARKYMHHNACKINKMPEFFMIFARKTIFPNLGEVPPAHPVSHAYESKRSARSLS